MRRIASTVVGAVVEAAAELRIHRTRVLLSLIGVAVAVAALTTVVGLGALASQTATESIERGGGRPATIGVSFSAAGSSDGQYSSSGSVPLATAVDAVAAAQARFGIGHATANGYANMRMQFPSGVSDVQVGLVGVDYAQIHRVEVIRGSWFGPADGERLAPALVVNTAFWQELGSPDLATHPTVALVGPDASTAVIVGVTKASYPGESPQSFVLLTAYERFADATQLAELSPSWEFWVPGDLAEQLVPILRTDLAAAVGDRFSVNVNRSDYLAQGEDPLLPVKLIVSGVAVLILFLGALSLVNISLVTVRQRIREIGIRRSFGATAGRVFFAVMMESVVGTVAAGVVGVVIAVVVVQNPAVQALLGSLPSDIPPFPVEAALIGLGSSVVVGAIAGMLPALVAVRVKVIDAIRY